MSTLPSFGSVVKNTTALPSRDPAHSALVIGLQRTVDRVLSSFEVSISHDDASHFTSHFKSDKPNADTLRCPSTTQSTCPLYGQLKDYFSAAVEGIRNDVSLPLRESLFGYIPISRDIATIDVKFGTGFPGGVHKASQKVRIYTGDFALASAA